MSTYIDYQEGKTTRKSEFNIINLESTLGSFSRAFEKWKRYPIPEFKTPTGQMVTAAAENVFLETPALMVFFINRVGFRNGKLEKDSQPFEFEDSILIAKAFESEKTVAVKNLTEEKERQINEEKATLTAWIDKASAQKDNIEQTIKYLKSQEVPLLS